MPERPGDMDERDVDARFASIIARWDGPVPADGTVPADDPTTDAEAMSGSDGASPDGATSAGASPDGASPAGDVETDAVEQVPPASPPAPWVNPSPLDLVVPASAWRAAEPVDPGAEAAEAALHHDHYEPPEVVLPPQEDLHFWGAVIGLVAGPLMLLYVVFARPFHSTRWFVAAVVVSLVGFALLVLRQPQHRDPTSGDDGARV